MQSPVLNEYARLTHVVVKHARDAFLGQGTLDAEWQAHGFLGPPDYAAAVRQYDAFLGALGAFGATVALLPPDGRTTIDAVYTRDASLVSPQGLVWARMGKALRQGEPEAQAEAHALFGGAPAAGAVQPPGTIEGGDVVWFDDRTVAVGRGYRTNAEGVRQFAALAGPTVTVVEVPLPHWRGPGDVLHLMSLLSPVDADLAVVYSPLLPVPFREWLVSRGITLVETPPEEFDSMGTNVLALAPRRCLMLDGNPRTRAALERAGATVVAYEGGEISAKGAGGPTCLTRPTVRLG